MRKWARKVAHSNMKRQGLTQVNKVKSVKSYFAKHWREYV